MPWNWWKRRPQNRSRAEALLGDGGGKEPPLHRLVRYMAEAPDIHRFVLRATADRGVMEHVKDVAVPIFREGKEPTAACRELCRRFGIPESIFLARLWALASFFDPDQVESQSPHQVLGVPAGADQETIKKAFRKLSLRWHPDMNPGNPEAAARFQLIKAAYDLLRDPSFQLSDVRERYKRAAWEEPFPDRESGAPGLWNRLKPLWPLAGVVIGLVVVVVLMDGTLRPRRIPHTKPASVITDPRERPFDPPEGASQPVRNSQVLPMPGKETGFGPWLAYSEGDKRDGWHLASAGMRIHETAPSSAPGAFDEEPSRISRDESHGVGLVEPSFDNPSPDDSPFEADAAPHETSAGPEREIPRSKAPSDSRESARRSGTKEPSPPQSESQSPSVVPPPSSVSESSSRRVRPAKRPARTASKSSIASKAAARPAPPPSNPEPRMQDLASVERRLTRFLEQYIRDYTRRDLQAFLRHFTPEATENGRPIRQWMDRYRENFQQIPWVDYRIQPVRWRITPEGLRMEGKFSLAVRYRNGRAFTSHGLLTMDLASGEDGFKVRSLEYRFQ